MTPNVRAIAEFFKNITMAQWFFLGFGTVTVLFVLLMIYFQKNQGQSNFKRKN